ncbi:hypothetical protein LTR56_000186 [Elasticomyces elasticus]|nr:hypothetical protein LTR56_000186 [Elasticomyces elasticus]KAK3667174.1 hypothetical protein LTR22_002039 [Elasticomyces elasticus]KAK4932948.1 hypothetical protein LTR49_000905 [Elasticomyces elasticus]KAK5768646.1 hypothetical protein LTS12_001071 [Elasticomyces elasticus]
MTTIQARSPSPNSEDRFTHHLDPELRRHDDVHDDHVKPPLEAFNRDALVQDIPTASPTFSDNRFIWLSIVPEVVEALDRNCINIDGADTAISLSTNVEDTLLLPSALLKSSHHFFKAGLGDRWKHNKMLEGGSTVYGPNIKYLYELELDSDGSTLLVGKVTPTEPYERFNAWSHADFSRKVRAREIKAHDQPEFVEWSRYTWSHKDYKQMCIAAHKTGFSILCGHPLRLRRIPAALRDGPPSAWSAEFLLQVFEWIHQHGDIRLMSSQLARFVLSNRDEQGIFDLTKCSYTFLRVAAACRSKDFFMAALEAATQTFARETKGFEHPIRAQLVNHLGQDHLLADYVLDAYHQIWHRLHSTEQALRYLKPDSPARQSHSDRLVSKQAISIWRAWYEDSLYARGGVPFDKIKTVCEGGCHVAVLIDKYGTVTADTSPPSCTSLSIPTFTSHGLESEVEKIILKAQRIAEASCTRFGDFIGVTDRPHSWNLLGALELRNNIYPWQAIPSTSGQPSRLTSVIDAVSAEGPFDGADESDEGEMEDDEEGEEGSIGEVLVGEDELWGRPVDESMQQGERMQPAA